MLVDLILASRLAMKFPNYSANSLNHIEPTQISTRRLVNICSGRILQSTFYSMDYELAPYNEDPSHGTFFWRLMFLFLGREPLVNHPPVSTIPRKYGQSCSCQEHQILPKPHLPFISFLLLIFTPNPDPRDKFF